MTTAPASQDCVLKETHGAWPTVLVTVITTVSSGVSRTCAGAGLLSPTADVMRKCRPGHRSELSLLTPTPEHGNATAVPWPPGLVTVGTDEVRHCHTRRGLRQLRGRGLAVQSAREERKPGFWAPR